MFCTNCGSPIPEGDRFCGNCGYPVEDEGQTSSAVAPNTPVSSAVPAVEQPKKKKGALVAIALVLLLLAALGVGGWYFLSRGKPVSEQAQRQQDAPKKEGAEADRSEKPAEEASVTRVADAYEAVLADADSYFAEPWYDQTPDTDAMYTLVDLNDDDVPELLLATHYSNVGSHTSGGDRILTFTYDEKADAAVQVAGDGFELFAEPYSLISYDATNHALIEEMRYVDGTNSRFNQVTVEDAKLVRKELEGEVPEEDAHSLEYAPIGDRSLLEQLRSNEAPAQKTEQDAVDNQAQLRATAEAAGKMVLTGHVVVLQGEDAMRYTGEGTFYANGEQGTEANAQSWYALLVLDEPTEISDILIADTTTSGTYDCILLGKRRYNVYRGNYDDEDGVAAWEPYDSTKSAPAVCIAASGFSKSSGTDYPGLPCPRDAEVLYTLS